jgi:hypothetical protein
MMPSGMGRGVLLVVSGLAALAAAGCHRDGCAGGDDGRCQPPSACQALVWPCEANAGANAGHLRVDLVKGTADRAPGPKALAAVDDFVLENNRIRAVLDAPGHPQGLAPTGGSIIDLAPIDPAEENMSMPLPAPSSTSGDQLNGIFQGAGLLPRDAVHYETAEMLSGSGDGPSGTFVGVVFRGHLEGDTRVTVVTRYELRPCEPGLRVRTDVYNGARDPNTLYLTDAFFWGDRTLLPFIPVQGHGFHVPDLDLLALSKAWRQWPFMAARTLAPPDVSYAVVPCDRLAGEGFNDPTLSASGVPLVTTLPGDGFSYERFILTAPGQGLSPAIDDALRARESLHGDPKPINVTGRVVWPAQAFDGRGGRAASLLFYEPAPGPDPDDEAGRTPRNEAVPGPDGRFHVNLPPNRVYRVQPWAFGRPTAGASSFAVGSVDIDTGDLTIPPAAHLVVNVVAGADRRGGYAELVIIPFEAPAATSPSLYGDFPGCDPMLGPPHGGSPACNRALTTDGHFDLRVPAGHYYVYVTSGPFASLDRRDLTLAAGDDVTISLSTQPLPDLVPAGTLSGDFHVHGGASYDTAIPDQDRVVSFLASGVDVIVATDHDVVTSYADTLASLKVGNRLIVIPGVEETPNILWFDVPGEDFPKTIGHFNFWPLVKDTALPRNGAPWDELREPGTMMDEMEDLFALAGAHGVRQMNHPWSESKLGRDQGFMRMIKMDPRKPLEGGDSFASQVLLRVPDKTRRNIDFDVQEVMTGASRRDWLRYRAIWFSLLSQGFLRAGAANSDTHTLAVERVGYPRNLVFGGHDREKFDREKFDQDVRLGHMFGTNGPVLDATIDDAAGALHRPGLEAFVPAPQATLTVAVAAAPWIPVQEVRVFINGELKKVLDVSSMFAARFAFGTVVRQARLTVPLEPPLLPATGDVWIVVEAGMHQDMPPDDEDGVSDGIPDLPDAQVPQRPAPGDKDYEDRFDLEAIAPGVWPTAFSNPFLLDRDGVAGWTAPGLPP